VENYAKKKSMNDNHLQEVLKASGCLSGCSR